MSFQGVLLNGGSTVIFLWGVGHLMATRGVVSGFGELSRDNTNIITMEWVIEGITLCFVGVLVAMTAWLLGPEDFATRIVVRMTAGLLLVLAVVSSFTGARTTVLPMKLCPFVKTGVALAYFVSTAV